MFLKSIVIVMKAIFKYSVLLNLLLLTIPQMQAAQFVSHSKNDASYNSLFIIFLILDVLFGLFLVFGKFFKYKKEETNYSYLESRKIMEEIS